MLTTTPSQIDSISYYGDVFNTMPGIKLQHNGRLVKFVDIYVCYE